MDIYGYPPYPYNESDEMSKQTLAQQALASSIPFPDREVPPEPHAMPAPTGTPWNIQGVPWGLSSPPTLVEFTARQALANRAAISSGTAGIHCKRKSLDVEPVIPAKQRITEEKMAAHLNGLHISSDYTSHSLQADNLMDTNMEPSTSAAALEQLKGHTIVLSEELKQIQKEPLLPAALIGRLENPRMSLVVWKPRESILETLKDDEKKSTEEEKPLRRNGVLVTDPPVDDVEM